MLLSWRENQATSTLTAGKEAESLNHTGQAMAHKGGSESQATKLPAGSGLAALRAGMDDAAHAAAAEFEKQTEDQTVQQPEQQAIEKENAEPMWNVGEWLRSLNYEEAVRELLEKAAKDSGMSPP